MNYTTLNQITTMLENKEKFDSVIKINRVKDEYGWLSCMSAHPIKFNNQEYRTCEALFQFERFTGYPEVQEEIIKCPSPMGAKMIARKNRNLLNRGHLWDQSEEDIEKMRVCLKLKLEQYPELQDKLLSTGDKLILEDCTTHDRESARFWGMVFKNDEWIGENHLGKLWMNLRDELKKHLYIPKRIFISPSALKYNRTQVIINRVKNLNPKAEIIYLENQTPKISELSPRLRYKYIKESLILCTRTSNYMEVFASPGKISENLGVVGKVHSHCPLQCIYCYLDVSGRSTPWVRVYVDIEEFYEQAKKERFVFRLAQTIWSTISFHLKTPIDKVPKGYKDVCDKIIRHDVLLQKSLIIDNRTAVNYLKNNLSYFFNTMGMELTEKELSSLQRKIPKLYKENSRYPLEINISEYSDVLGLDHITNLMEELMQLIQKDSEFHIKLRTKSAHISNLFKYDGNNQVQVTFSLNTSYVNNKYEIGASDLDKMISAIKALQDKGGYKIQIAIEPIIKYMGFEDDYPNLINKLKSEIDFSKILKFKIGTVRYKTRLKNHIERVHPGSGLFSKHQKLVEPEKGDKRWRYSKEDRLKIYSDIMNELQDIPGLKLGLASENPELWDTLKLDKGSIHNDVVYQYNSLGLNFNEEKK